MEVFSHAAELPPRLTLCDGGTVISIIIWLNAEFPDALPSSSSSAVKDMLMVDKVGWLARTGRADYPRYPILSHGAGAGIAPTCRGIFFTFSS